ncbi:MAG: hypothetical protein H6812_10095 [Phycisphaeraceae bacterium]|nr:hypothetical protein [Phycisphaeraceae bacterium]
MAAANRTAGVADHSDIEAIREDLATLKSDFGSLVTDLAEGGRHAAQKSAQAIAGSAKSTAEHVKAAHSATCDTVKQHPMAAVLVAAGVGAIAARLLMKNSR